MASDNVRCFMVFTLAGKELLVHKCKKSDTRGVSADG